MREKRGITLIALVITIIVLLILAGFSISTILGDDGIITKASNAKLNSEIALEEESIEMAMTSLKVDKNGNIKTVTPDELYNYMSKNSAAKPVRVESGDEQHSLRITFGKERGNRSYLIAQDGKLSEYKEHAQTISDPSMFIFNEETGMIEGFANLESDSYYYYQTDGWYLYVEPLEYEEKDKNGNTVVKTTTDVIIDVPKTINGVTVIGIADHAFTSHQKYYSSARYMADQGHFYGGFKNIIEIKLPETIKYIGDNAFSDNVNLKRINIPSNVEYIGNYAFAWCTKLKNITLPNGLTSINKCTFVGCESLTNTQIPNSVEAIDTGAFAYCKSLTNMKLPNSITILGDNAFYNCESLISIELSNSIISIGTYAFGWCENLAGIVIPASVEIMEGYVFCGCDKFNIIYCVSTSKPEGWDDNWAYKQYKNIYHSVTWGYTEN